MQNYYAARKCKPLTMEWLPRLCAGPGCEDRDFWRIPRLTGDQNGVNLTWMSPHYPAKARGGGSGGFKWLVHYEKRLDAALTWNNKIYTKLLMNVAFPPHLKNAKTDVWLSFCYLYNIVFCNFLVSKFIMTSSVRGQDVAILPFCFRNKISCKRMHERFPSQNIFREFIM